MTDTEPVLPHPVTAQDEYLAAIYRRLGDILDRLPKPVEVQGPTVELREVPTGAPDEGVTPAEAVAAEVKAAARRAKPSGSAPRRTRQPGGGKTGKPRGG